MRLLYTSDLHGSERLYADLLAAGGSAKPDLVILGGDLLPDDSAMEPETLGHDQPRYVRTTFRENIRDLRDRSGCREVFVIFGNHDWASSVQAMQELADEGLVTILDPKRCVEFQGLSFLGYSYTPPTPWFVKDFERLDKADDRPPLLGGANWDARFSRPVQHGAAQLFQGRPTIAEDMASISPPADPWVFVIHAPPFGTKLDQSYGRQSYGSRAVREALETYQPLLSLHGHIHESAAVTGHWRDELGKTVAINPGQNSQMLSHVIIEVDVAGNKITGIQRGQSS